MPTSERTLRNWRKEALKLRAVEQYNKLGKITELNNKILTLTQELLDIALLKKEEK